MMTKMVINPNRKLSRINRQIYGHFSTSRKDGIMK